MREPRYTAHVRSIHCYIQPAPGPGNPWSVVPIDHVSDWYEEDPTLGVPYYMNPLAGTIMTEMNDKYFVEEDEVR